MAVSLGGIAAFGIALPSDAQLPGVRADLHISRQADEAIREGQAGGDGSAERAGGIRERTGTARGLGLGGKLNIRLRLVQAPLTARPLGCLALVVVAIPGHAVAKRAERDTVLIIAALETGQGLVVSLGMHEPDGAQGMQILVNISEHALMPFPGIAEHFANGEVGETQPQVLEARNRQQVIIAVGSGERAGDRPEGEETVIHDVESLGFIAEVMLAVRSRSLFWILETIGIMARLIRPCVINVGRLRIAESGETAMLPAGRCVTLAAFLASFPGRAGTCGGRLGAGRDLVAAAHVRAGVDQLAVSGDGNTPVGRILGERGVTGNQSIGHQTEQQAALAGQEPVFGGILAGHPESGGAWQIILLETQCLAVSVAAFGLAELVRQAGPVPFAIDREQHGQAQAERIEAGGTKVAFETRAKIRPPGGEVEQAQAQVKGIHTRQVNAGMDLIGRQPVVAGATSAILPGRRLPGAG